MTAAVEAAAPRELPPIPKLGAAKAAESIAWVLGLGHIVKWAVDAAYFLITQVRYAVGYGKTTWTVFYLRDAWNHAPRYVGRWLHIPWLQQPWVDNAWVVPRHDTRALVIGILYGVVIHFLFSKPMPYRPGARLPAWRYPLTIPAALVFAVPGVAAGIGIVSQVPWAVHHGLSIHGTSILANEVNGWVSAGHWHLFILGLLGSYFFARYATRRPADEAQWFYAERIAAAQTREATGLAAVGNIVQSRIWGPPGLRTRVHYLIGNQVTCPDHSAWMTRWLVGGGILTLLLAGFGAWLTLAGPAAGV